MPRSTYINTLIGECIFSGLTVIVNDGEENHTCKTFKDVAKVVDSVDDCTIYLNKVISETSSIDACWFTLTMENGNEAQLNDYTVTKLGCSIVDTVQRLQKASSDLTYHSPAVQQRLMGESC